MRLVTRIPRLRWTRIAVLGARSAPKRHSKTRRGLCRDIKGRALAWFARNDPGATTVFTCPPVVRTCRRKTPDRADPGTAIDAPRGTARVQTATAARTGSPA